MKKTKKKFNMILFYFTFKVSTTVDTDHYNSFTEIHKQMEMDL